MAKAKSGLLASSSKDHKTVQQNFSKVLILVALAGVSYLAKYNAETHYLENKFGWNEMDEGMNLLKKSEKVKAKPPKLQDGILGDLSNFHFGLNEELEKKMQEETQRMIDDFQGKLDILKSNVAKMLQMEGEDVEAENLSEPT